MKKHILSILLISLFSCTITTPLTTFATENTAIQSEPLHTVHNELDKDENSIKFHPVKINFMLEGIEMNLKNSKILNDPSNFWSDYTIKFSNNLMYGGIDIQESIRGYKFSHYEIGGLRIESIDAIIEAKDENTTINVVYAEETPKGGYLRKGFRNGIGLDINYLNSCIAANKIAYTDLYDSRWTLALPNDFSKEILDGTHSFINANDKTLYFNASVSNITDKQQLELTQKYGYIDSIKISSSLHYNDFENDFILTYTSPTNILELEDVESKLYGINLEGKVELLSTSCFNDNVTSFKLKNNTNQYQLLFIGSIPETNISEEYDISSEHSSSEEENINTNLDDNKESVFNQNTINFPNENQKHLLDERTFVLLSLSCFATGAICTFILSLILSIRNENIAKKKTSEQKENKQ